MVPLRWDKLVAGCSPTKISGAFSSRQVQLSSENLLAAVDLLLPIDRTTSETSHCRKSIRGFHITEIAISLKILANRIVVALKR